MGRKSRHGHKKYRTATITRKEEPGFPTPGIQRPNGNLNAMKNPAVSKLKPEVVTAKTISAPDREKYAYVKNELLEVGILTVVILVVLVITALLLR